ncbi:hypothetical protein PVAP13_6NG004100 [Panicum virgatum]|uniref:Uncharacterized protein n=1 Tax=Panicum virgatum TaxID=38727 RepID=A0A8T0QSI2_PANVG|nr:hypothetical protein PVAP13_6NG004100 [Panicum virgatum]
MGLYCTEKHTTNPYYKETSRLERKNNARIQGPFLLQLRRPPLPRRISNRGRPEEKAKPRSKSSPQRSSKHWKMSHKPMPTNHLDDKLTTLNERRRYHSGDGKGKSPPASPLSTSTQGNQCPKLQSSPRRKTTKQRKDPIRTQVEGKPTSQTKRRRETCRTQSGRPKASPPGRQS